MAKTDAPAIKVPFSTIVGLLGKSPKDPAVQAVIAKAGKVTVKSDFIIAKEAGFDFCVGQPEGAKGNTPKVLTSVFLFGRGIDGHRGYADLPAGFTFSTRDELLAALPAPVDSFKIGKGSVPVSTPGVISDSWIVDGVRIVSMYREGAVRNFNVAVVDATSREIDLDCDPLYYETKPVDAPADANLVGMALLVAWAAARFGLPAKHARSPLGKQLLARTITPRTFLIQACNRTLTSADVAPELVNFLDEYHHQRIDDDGTRAKADAAIAKLLCLDDKEDRKYVDDFLGTFSKVVSNPFYVPDSWSAVDRIAPVLDARYADFEATHFETPPKLELYAKAAKQRDKIAIEPDRARVAKSAIDDSFADDLVAAIGTSLKDKAVHALLARASLPVGKKIDEQANPKLGVSYMGAKIEIGGTSELAITSASFYAAKQRSYVRGIGAEVEFAGYPGRLPKDLALGESRASVAKRLGAPKKTYEDTDYWDASKRLRMNCKFHRGKLVEIYIGLKRD